MLTLDTNVIIYYLKGDTSVRESLREWRTDRRTMFASTITELELLSSPNLTSVEAEKIDRFLLTITLIGVDSHLARIAADLRRRYRMRTPDAAIAATALFSQSSLVTRNVKHFNDIEELTLQPI